MCLNFEGFCLNFLFLGASLLQMLVSCMSELLSMDDWNWDFVLNLSESDYPLKNPKVLTDFLSDNREKNFVKSHGRDSQVTT